jgi:uncharacterized protein
MTTMQQPDTTVSAPSPAATVAAIYEAFGRGDVPAILDLLADDVVFDDDTRPSSAQEAGYPLFLPHRGKDGVVRFFAELGEYQFREFDVTDLLVGDSCVASRVLIEVATPSGEVIHDDVMHLWRFDDTGLVSGLRHYADTAKHLAAWRTAS